jgi:NAD+ diphosphatase
MNARTPGFTGLSLDRADNLRMAADRIAELAAAEQARLMRLAGMEPLLSEDGRLSWDSIRELEEEVELLFLGISGDSPLFAPLLQNGSGANPARMMFTLLETMPAEDAALWGVAHSLIIWHNRNGFCGNCGATTAPFRAGWGRRCTGCGAEHFPRVDPVVIMLAEYGDRVLLGRQPVFPPRRFSALAGFVEPGESIEEAVARELKEEAGVVTTEVRYISSQPWPFPGQLMIGCIATAQSDEVQLEPTELEDSIWVDRSEVAAALAGDEAAPFIPPPPFAIAHSLLAHWADLD